jgi:fumarate hydratase subunit alpha
MREISSQIITETVSKLCIKANVFLPDDVSKSLETSALNEKKETALGIFREIIENSKIAKNSGEALCQDTGIAEIFLKIGQDVHISGGNIKDAVNKGVEEGYKKGFLRKSVVNDPLERKNTGSNAPAVIYTEIVPGEKLEITVLPKGGGSENASTLEMLAPLEGWEGIKRFVIESVKTKGIKSCPPLIVGVGIGGSFSSVPLLSKKALLREIGSVSKNNFYAKKEQELLEAINETNVGPMGLGGNVTALAVHIEAAPCHIASMPVAVSMQCHSCRRMTATL